MADDESISIRIRLRDAAKFAAETRKAKREIDQLGDATQKANRKAREASVGYSLLQRTLKLTKAAALIAGFTLLAQAGASATGVTIALVAALAPLVGLLGALPALAVLGGQGLGVAALGLMGVTDAVGGLNAQIDPKKFALLQRPAQDFALSLDALKPKLLGLQAAVQKGMFPGLTEGLHDAAPAITALQGPLAGTGREIGMFGSSLGKLVGSRGFLADLRSQAEFNNVQLGRLGGAGLHVVNVFRNLMVAARPLVSWIVRLVAGWSASADTMTETGRASGGLQKGFHTVQVTTERVWKLLSALGHALFNVGNIGRTAIGGGLLLALVRGAQALERWTESTEGVHDLNAAFDGSQHVLGQIADFASGIATGVGPSVVQLTKDMITAFEPLIHSGGGAAGIKLYVDGLDLLAGAVIGLENVLPGGTTALSALLALMLVNSKLQVVGFARDGIGLVTRGMRLLTVATGLATVAGAAEMGIMEATTVAATGMWLAITGPVGLVIIAIGAVVATVLILYNKWGWFHRAVDNTFDFIKSHWPLILAIITGPFGLAVLEIVKHFDTIKGAAKSVFAFIARTWNGVAGKLHFKAPGWVPGIGGKGFGLPKIPGYANGTPFHPGGLALVGERGPEILSLPRASRVDPLPAPSLSAPRMAAVNRSGGGGTGAAMAPIHVHSTVTVKVDRKTLAKAVAEAVADEKAGG